jgi:hypothetical protein
MFTIEKTFEERSVGQAYRYEEHAVYYDRSYNPEYDDPNMVFSHMEVKLHAFHIKRFTPKGFWIFGVVRDRFVLNKSEKGKKRYAWLSKRDAIESFLARKEVHASYASKRLARVEMSIKEGERVRTKVKEEMTREAVKPLEDVRPLRLDELTDMEELDKWKDQ